MMSNQGQGLLRLCMFCAYTRLRYQVSIHGTIGPLVYGTKPEFIAFHFNFTLGLNTG